MGTSKILPTENSTYDSSGQTTKDILTLAVEIADTMLRSGAEIYRIEDTVTRILKAFDVEHFDVYVLSNGIFASANEDMDDACSMIRHVPLGAVDLGKVSALNQLTRELCSHEVDCDGAWKRLKEIRSQKDYPLWLLILACGVGSGCFCYLFGGNVMDSLFSFLIGALEEGLILLMGRAKISRFVNQVIAAFFVSAASYIPILATNSTVHHDKMVIGAIMVLVPGIVFTTSIRDFYNGDYLSGSIHLLDALLTALCIAVGVCLAIFLFTKIGGGALA